jgi:hypothetical protein
MINLIFYEPIPKLKNLIFSGRQNCFNKLTTSHKIVLNMTIANAALKANGDRIILKKIVWDKFYA